MKRIKLTQGQYALVDDEDYDWLMQWKWYAQWSKCTQSFYAVRRQYVGKRVTISILMHRQLLLLEKGDKRQVDHSDHNTLNNQRFNIKIVTCRQNHWNRLNVKGYTYDKRKKKYQSQITVGGCNKWLGYFDTPFEAILAYTEAKATYHCLDNPGHSGPAVHSSRKS